MPRPENRHGAAPEGAPEPGVLPPELAEYLRGQDAVCLMHETNLGTVFVVKLPGSEIASVRGTVPIHLRHELYRHPSAPVIRTVMHIIDRPDAPLALKTFPNTGAAYGLSSFSNCVHGRAGLGCRYGGMPLDYPLGPSPATVTDGRRARDSWDLTPKLGTT